MSEKILVTRSSLPEFNEYMEEIQSIWTTHWLTNMGPKYIQFMNMLTEYLQVENIDIFTNGHMAIELSLQSLKLPKGGEVITTPFTFASTTHAIIRNGLEPVFCDINARDFTIDISKVEELITDRTCAIMPVHVYGNICNIEEIDRIAKKYDLRIIYDAAHAFGEKYKGQGIGTFGDVSCFSFHATKVFNSIEGGAACFKNKDLGLELYRLKNFGIRNTECVDRVGTNAKMNEFCAAMGICNLRHIDSEIEKRKKLVMQYREKLQGIPGVQLNVVQNEVESNYAYFPVVFDEKAYGHTRNEVFDYLEKHDICVRKYFYPLTNTFECFQGKYDVNKTPVALRVSKRILTLPLYADLMKKDVDRICELIFQFQN